MQKTEERLNERADLTDKQKEKIAGILNTDKGQGIWSKRSLTPDGRIATARLLAGDGDPDIMAGLSREETAVVKFTVRESGRDRGRGRGR